jgi:hypothetical protein
MQTLKIKCIQLEVSTGVLVLIGPTEDCEEDTSSMVHRLEHATLDVCSHAPWSKAWCDHHEEYNPPMLHQRQLRRSLYVGKVDEVYPHQQEQLY